MSEKHRHITTVVHFCIVEMVFHTQMDCVLSSTQHDVDCEQSLEKIVVRIGYV